MNAVFGRYSRELHNFILRRIPQSQDVNDLAQEVYLRLHRIPETRVIEKPLAYLYGISKRVLADFRIEVDERREHIAEVDPEDWYKSPSLVLPDDLGDRLNLQQQLDRALASLPPMHAAVILAHKRDGLSYEEVAKKLGVSVHTVEKYVTQAKARIRSQEWDR
jgi:RNA polymerase sigma-70 factor (ECF subfamily)